MALRMFENLDLWFPSEEECEGEYDFPIIQAQELPEIQKWVPFSGAKGKELDATVGVHMFVDDYRMARLWNLPCRYINMLKNAGCVLSPDFSMYTDEPKALQVMNAYKRQWLGAWWQKNGMTVIPTVCWADEDSYEWCFDGFPHNAVLAVSTVGTQKHRGSKKLFMKGYDAMVERCEPKTVLVFGNIPTGIKGNIVNVASFTKEIKERLHK